MGFVGKRTVRTLVLVIANAEGGSNDEVSIIL